MSDDPQVSTPNDATPTPVAGQPAPAPTFENVDDLPPFWRDKVKDLRTEGQNKGARISALESELNTARSESTQKEATLTQ